MNYELPYTGSKNTIAEKIIEHFPEADTLVDVFFGGGAGTRRRTIEKLYTVK